MLPDFATLHFRNQTPTDTKISGDGSSYLACFAALANLSDQIVGKFRVAIPGTAAGIEGIQLAIKAVLGDAVKNVVFLSSCKEMSRVNTTPCVAGMEDVRLVVGDLAISDQIGNPMCSFVLVGREPELPVPSFDAGCRPQPARVRAAAAIHLLPKALKLFRGKLHSHRVLLTLGATPGVVTATPRLSVLSPQLYQMGGGR